MEVSTSECLYVQAFGLDRCENCPFDYQGDPAICGGKRFKKLIKEGKFPKGGSLKAKWFLKGMEHSEALERKRIAEEARARKVLSQRNLVSRMWGWIGHWLERKPPEIKSMPTTERARIEQEPRKPFNAERLWIWFIVGILIVLMWVLTGKDEERLSVEQTIEERETRELLEEVIRLIEEYG